MLSNQMDVTTGEVASLAYVPNLTYIAAAPPASARLRPAMGGANKPADRHPSMGSHRDPLPG